MSRTLVFRWLLASAALVLAMVAVGGITRLTRSGLSIVEWNPVAGILPPLSSEQWNHTFEAYRNSPEGRLVNQGLDLEGFQRIFLVEWFHRLLGRFVGVFFFVPWLVFAVKKLITRAEATRFLLWFALGGAQGALGWFMVKSGLVDVPHVSPYRLTAHLLLALVVYVGLLWEALRLRRPRGTPSNTPTWPSRALASALVVTIGWGGLMAGFKAGWLSDTFPLMAGQWVPTALWAGDGLAAPFSNPFAVHFTHRLLGILVVVLSSVVAWTLRPAPVTVRRMSWVVLGFALVQVGLGAGTVWLHVPTTLAVLHQLNAAFLLGAVTSLIYIQPPPLKESKAAEGVLPAQLG